MDWNRAIARNAEALETIVAALFLALGLGSGSAPSRIPRALHAQALRVLRPAESALRRLIVIAARGLVAKHLAKRGAPQGPIPRAKPEGRAAFRLFDPRKRFGSSTPPPFGPKREPRIHVFGNPGPLVPLLQATPRSPVPPSAPETDINAMPLRRRLEALAGALSNIPHQAMRLARWQAKRRQLSRPAFTEPLRPGRPPGHRRVKIHEVDHILAECHGLSFDALRPDTS